jgi:hypothetical protein
MKSWKLGIGFMALILVLLAARGAAVLHRGRPEA